MKRIVPCEVAIKRFYRMYVEVEEGATNDEVKAKAVEMLTETRAPDSKLTPGDLYNEIEEQDILENDPDWEASWTEQEDKV